MKKFFAIILATMILVSSSFAAFSDLPKGHWAEGVVSEMVEAGIISGYTDGTFRPTKEISKIESLILISRVAGLNKYPTQADNFLEKYSSILSKYSTQYKKDVAYLLGVNVLKESDLDNFLLADKVNSPLTREEMAILVTKTLGKEEEATKNSIVVLPFADTSTISASAKPYVYYVYSQKIMSGMTGTTFSPKTSLTRAQAASVLQRIYKKIDIDLSSSQEPVNNPSATSFVTGSITKIDTSASSVWIKSNGTTEEYEYDSKTKFYVNSKELTSSAMKVNATVTATVTDDLYIASMNISEGAKITTKTVKATIYAASSSAKTITVTTNGLRVIYNYDNATKFVLDGKDSTIQNTVKKDAEVTLTVDSTNYIEKLSATSPDKRIIGEIVETSTKYGYIVIEDEDDEEYILMDGYLDKYNKNYEKTSEDYIFDDDTEYKYNGSTKTYKNIATSSYLYKEGNYVALTLGKNDYIDLVEVATKKSSLDSSSKDSDKSTDENEIIGEIFEASTKKGYLVIEDVDSGKEYILMDDVINEYDGDYDGEDEDYYFDDDTEFYYEGDSSTYKKMATSTNLYKKGNFVRIVIGKNEYIEEIEIASKESRLDGSSSSSKSDSLSSEDMMDDNYLVGEITKILEDELEIEADDGEEYTIDIASNAIFIEYDSSKPGKNFVDYLDAYDEGDIDKGDRVMVILCDDEETALIILLD